MSYEVKGVWALVVAVAIGAFVIVPFILWMVRTA